MSGDIVNLNKKRKQKARAAERKRAAANSARSGRTTWELQRGRLEREKRERLLDQARLKDD